MRPPNAAALPLIDTSLLPTRLLESVLTASMRAARSIDAPEVPVLSVPLPRSFNERPAGSTSRTETSPRNDIVAGPTFTVTVPL